MGSKKKKAPHYTLHTGDALRILKTLPDNTFDSMPTDPPAGIGFMSKPWDSARGGRDKWIAWLTAILVECLRVLKPGAHGAIWAYPRTAHWTALAIENAGFEIVTVLTHLFADSFPKQRHSLKPTTEYWYVIRKPISERNVAANMKRWGVGRLFPERVPVGPSKRHPGTTLLSHAPGCNKSKCIEGCPVLLLDRQSGERPAGRTPKQRIGSFFRTTRRPHPSKPKTYDDPGGASKYFPTFFYCPKASKKDRGEGNDHPTAKNTLMMGWLCKLITPCGGLVLDPFSGSASIGVGCLREGFGYVGIEKEKKYVTIARQRLKRVIQDEYGMSA